jgi:preprotein translocase subunit SecE
MNKIKQMVTGLRNFLEEVRAELKKCSWPARPELVESTVVVIVSVLIVAVFVGASDIILMGVLRMVVR